MPELYESIGLVERQRPEQHAVNDAEVRELLDILMRLDEETGRSFYTTRKAELEHLWGDNRLARTLIEQAINRSSAIFEQRRIYTEILLKEGNKAKAWEEISWMRDKVNSRDPRERRTNYRLYLETYAHYLTEIGQFDRAKEIFNDSSIFTEIEKNAAVRNIQIVQTYKDAGKA